jgi:hypothetical protein
MKILSRTTRKINGKWYARVRYEDENGKKGELLRRAEGKSDTENLKATDQVSVPGAVATG